MKNILKFLLAANTLKGKKRRGWLIHRFKNPETTGEHLFHLALLAWVLGKEKKININRAIKIALIHDLCEIYAPDLTPYDALSITNQRKINIKDILKARPKIGRPTLEQRKKLEKIKQRLEVKAMKKLLAKLPKNIKEEMNDLWLDYEEGRTPEGRFVKQADRIENLLQGLSYWKQQGKIPYRLWVRRIKEVIDDPTLIRFFKKLEKEFFGKKTRKSKGTKNSK